jgi:predicted nucleic acid-binding protein
VDLALQRISGRWGEPGESRAPREPSSGTPLPPQRPYLDAWRFVARTGRSRRTISALTHMELIQGYRSNDEVARVGEFVDRNVARLIYPDDRISRRATELLTIFAMSHGLRVVDALIAATSLEARGVLATANVRHYRFIQGISLQTFRPAQR